MFLINVAAYLVIGEILWSLLGHIDDASVGSAAPNYDTWRFVYGIIMLVLLAIGIGEAIRKREKK